MMMMKAPYPAVVASMALVAPNAFAALSITNGDFQSGGNVSNQPDVTNWFDSNTGDFFEQAWMSSDQSPNGSNVVIFSSLESDDFGMPSSNANDGSYIYQGIGTADGASTVPIGFDWGAPNDDPGDRNIGVSVGIYAYDGVGGFSAADGTDVRGGAGVTLLDSASFTIASTTAGGQIENELAELDLTGAGSDELFVRFNGYLPGSGESWPFVDNVTIVPEPSIALLGGLGLFGLLRRRRR